MVNYKQLTTNSSHLCASVTKQYNLVPVKGRWFSAAGEVTAGLAESNGSLPLGGWLTVTCRPTACTPGSAPGPTLGIECGKPLPFFTAHLWAGVRGDKVAYWVWLTVTVIRIQLLPRPPPVWMYASDARKVIWLKCVPVLQYRDAFRTFISTRIS